MPTQIGSIIPRRIDFRTQTNTDWLDGLLVWTAGAGGVVAGAGNVGNGALVVASVDPGAALGAHIVSITSTDGVTRLTVEAPDGTVTARGVVGLPVYAAGIRFTLSAGSTPFAIDDTFAIGVLPVSVDVTGLRFVMDARLTAQTANVALRADSAPEAGTPTIATGGTGGTIGMVVPASRMDASVFAPAVYVYDIIAVDPETGRKTPVFYGSIEHVYGATLIP